MFSIAIDGPSGSGKSSMAKLLSKHYKFIYVDTGAIYRTTGLACVRRGISCKDESEVEKLLPELDIEIKYDVDGAQKMFLNGEDVSAEIRTPEISIAASDVSSLGLVRAYLLDMQRKFARESDVILDGRDIGTVVLPDAQCKIFLTASAEERARRRMLELEEKGTPQKYEDVLKDIEYRDSQDTHRDVAPLKQAEDAVVLDTTNLDFDQTFDALVAIVDEKINHS